MLRSLLAPALSLIVLAQKPTPEFTINLDLPPQERHREVALFFKDMYPNFMTAWEGFLSRKVSPEERAQWMGSHHAKQEIQDEIRGFVETIDHPQVTYERVMLFNLMYELNFPVFCSGVVAADATGRVMHGRNLDLIMNFKSGTTSMNIGDIAANYTYVSNGTALFNSHAIAGFVGVHTALKLSGAHPWSIQQNSHNDNNRKKNLEALSAGAVPFAFYVRELLKEDVDFAHAVFRLSNASFGAPNFFLMAGAGPWEGAAIEVRRNSPDPTMSDVQVIAPQIGRWFLVQTNDLAFEEPLDDRRPAALQLVSALGGPPGMNEDSLMKVMRTRPLFNDYTTVSVVSVPATGRIRALGRNEYWPDVNLFSKSRRFKIVLR